MLRARSFWDGGSCSLLNAPELRSSRPLQNPFPAGFNPQFDRTSGSTRLLFSLGFGLAQPSPPVLVFEGEQTCFRLNFWR